MVDTVSRPPERSDDEAAKNGKSGKSGKNGLQYRNGAGRRPRNGQATPEQQKIAAARKSWEEKTVAGSLTKLPERFAPEKFTTISGEPVERIYTPADLVGMDYKRGLGFPGEYPFTRGV